MTLTSLRYIDAGQGETTIVLLHGLFGSPENWRVMIDQLGDRYRFIALQLPIDHIPGRNKSDFECIGQLTEYVKAVFDEVGLEKAVLCGNSLGGQVALDFYLEYPEQVSHLILTGSAGLFERSLSGGRRPKVCRAMIREQIAEILYDEAAIKDELIDEVYTMLSDRGYSRFLLRIAKATRNLNMSDQLARIAIPTLIIWGANDRITPPFVADQFHKGIDTSQLVFIDHCGHAPPLEQPEEFTRIMDEFLSKSDGSAPAEAAQTDQQTPQVYETR